MSFRSAIISSRLSALAGLFACTIAIVAFAQTAQAPPAPAGTAPGQSSAPAPASQGTPTFRVTAREVLLDVLVSDKNGLQRHGRRRSPGHSASQRAPRDG